MIFIKTQWPNGKKVEILKTEGKGSTVLFEKQIENTGDVDIEAYNDDHCLSTFVTIKKGDAEQIVEFLKNHFNI